MVRRQGRNKNSKAAAVAAALILFLPHAVHGQWNCAGGTCSTTSNVAIGTTDPGTSRLRVKQAQNTYAGGVAIEAAADSNTWFQWLDSGYGLSVGINGNSAAMRIASNGNVGIGTTNPTARLFVVGPGGTTPALYLTGSPLESHGPALTNFQYTMTGDFQQIGNLFNLNHQVSTGTHSWDANSVFALVQHTGTGRSPYNVGLRGGAGVADGGLVTNSIAIEANGVYQWLNSAGGTIDNAFGVRVQTSGPSTALTTVGTFYGLYLENPTRPGIAVATKYGIYQQDVESKNYFAGNVGIGTTVPQHKLSVNGTIGTKEVVVTSSGWPDYVLTPGYALTPLHEVAAYIKENQRLPEIPSAKEVEEKGVSLGDMQVRLLAKIEELTLHVIQLDERNRQLEKEIEELKDTRSR